MELTKRLHFLPASLRGRLMLLMLLAVLPGFILLTANTFQERKRAEDAQLEILTRIAGNLSLKGRERERARMGGSAS